MNVVTRKSRKPVQTSSIFQLLIQFVSFLFFCVFRINSGILVSEWLAGLNFLTSFLCHIWIFSFVTSDFDKRVNDNKTAAEDAMKKIPAINATIMAANEKTRQAEAALGNAAADAREAKNKAEEAERIASNVQKVRQEQSGTCCLRLTGNLLMGLLVVPLRAQPRPKRMQRRPSRTPASWTTRWTTWWSSWALPSRSWPGRRPRPTRTWWWLGWYEPSSPVKPLQSNHSSKTSLCVCSTVYCPTGVRQREGSGGQRPQGQERRQDCPEHHHRPAGSAG